MFELIAFIILLASSVGICFILARKIPALAQLPQNGHHGLKKPSFIANIENRLKHHHFHLFEKQMLLHKILSLVKVWTLKTERVIDNLLHGIRKKAQELDRKKKGKK